jgi:hypothetical protein
MANMSYCRFENTLRDLQDCYHNMEGVSDHEEQRARQRLIDLCKDIIDDYGDNFVFNDDEEAFDDED